jgi:hypothetical protein
VLKPSNKLSNKKKVPLKSDPKPIIEKKMNKVVNIQLCENTSPLATLETFTSSVNQTQEIAEPDLPNANMEEINKKIENVLSKYRNCSFFSANAEQ